MSRRIRFTEVFESKQRSRLVLAALAVCLLVPATVWAHARWIPNNIRWPINLAYFQSLEGNTLLLTLAGTVSLAGVIIAFFVVAPGVVERLTPVTDAQRQAEAHMNAAVRGLRYFVRLLLDGPFVSRTMETGLEVATFIFSKIPAPVLFLGAYQGWVVMPSYPLSGVVGDVLTVASVVLGIWVLIGKWLRPLGTIMFLIYFYLIYEYGVAGVDAIPVLASAFFYFYHDPENPGVNGRQLLGMRLSLGIGFYLLGLINKIYLAQLIIGVADHYPQLVAGPQASIPDLTREGWAFSGAIGEMVFGMLVLIGVFNRATTLALAFIFGNFVLVFGWPEVVHIYPIAGFIILFFRGPLGSPLDGPVFNLAVKLMDSMKGISFQAARLLSVGMIGTGFAFATMLVPTWFFMEQVPHMDGTAVPGDYVPPSPPPPAKAFMGVHPARHEGIVARVGDFEVELSVHKDGTIKVFASDLDSHPVDPSKISGQILVGPEGSRVAVPLRQQDTGLIGQGPPLTQDTDYVYDLTIKGKPVSMLMPIMKEGTERMMWSSEVLTVLVKQTF